MAVKYVKDFVFGPMTSVQRYAKGGHVTKVPAKAKPAAKGMPAKAKPNAPATGAKKMASPPKVGKGQGYKDGGKVPGREMDRLPTKTPPGRGKDLAPAKPFKGAYEGYAKGGKARRYAEGGDVEDPRAATITPGAGGLDSVRYNQYGEADPFEGRPVRYEGQYSRDLNIDEMLRRDRERVQNDAAQQMRDLANLKQLERSPYRPVDESELQNVQMIQAPLQQTPARPPVTYDPYGDRPVRDTPVSPYEGRMEPAEPAMARAVRNVGANRNVGLSDIIRAAREQGMMRVPGMPQTAMYAKGGHVKGQAKVGKVMGEYKRGELHSGSKKGPLVKNPKQAVAIALSEARKSGAKIPKKEEGGLMASKPEVRKPKSVTVTKVTKTVSDAKDAALNEKKMLEFLRSLPKDEIADMMERRAMQAPAMDPDMPKYRRGGVARKGIPVHKGKAMYGGGKC